MLVGQAIVVCGLSKRASRSESVKETNVFSLASQAFNALRRQVDALLFPLAIGWLGWRFGTGAPVFGPGSSDASLLVLAGVVSTTPLILFTEAARRLAYSTLGML